MRPIIRLSVGVVVMSAVLLLSAAVSPAFGSVLGKHRMKPVVVSDMTVSFTIPAKPANGEWVLRVWGYATMPPASPTNPGTLEDETFGSGTGTVITASIPMTSSCDFQFDVKVDIGGNSSSPITDFVWYSGLIANVADCGGCGPNAPRIGAPTHAGSSLIGDNRAISRAA
jgi:hypothetical protein